MHALGHASEAVPVALEASECGSAAGSRGHQRRAGHRTMRRGARVLAVLVTAAELTSTSSSTTATTITAATTSPISRLAGENQ